MSSNQPTMATETANTLLLITGHSGCTARFNPSLYQLEINCEKSDRVVELGFSGSRVLERLLQKPGEVVSRDELMRFGWENRVVGQGSLSQQIYTLRQILFDVDNQIIQTLPRRGYLFNPQYVQRAPEPVAPVVAQPVVAPEPVLSVATLAAEPLPAVAATPAPVAAGRPTRSYLAWLFGTGALLLSGVAVMGMRLIDFHEAAFQSQQHHVGQLSVTYLESDRRQLKTLVSRTRPAVERLSELVDRPSSVIVSMSPGFYEIHCLRDSGHVNWLKIHRDRIGDASADFLSGCLR